MWPFRYTLSKMALIVLSATTMTTVSSVTKHSASTQLQSQSDEFRSEHSIAIFATDAKVGARFAVLSQSGPPAMPKLEVQGEESDSKPFTFDKPQTLSILVQAIKPADKAGGRGTYSIQVRGPVTLIN